jgi:hypothetical protein
VSFKIIKRTPVADNVVIMTTRKTDDPHLLRPFATFTVIPTTRHAQRLTDFATEAAALHAHNGLARTLQAKRSA